MAITAISAIARASCAVGVAPGITLDSSGVSSAANGAMTRAPMPMAKLSPVPRRCSGKTRGRQFPRKLYCVPTIG